DAARLARLRIELVGRWLCPDREAVERRLRRHPNVVHREPVPYRGALGLMCGADALLHVDVPTDRRYFRPSKLVEYLGANRPIVAFCSPGAGERFAREAGGIHADVRSAPAVAAA